MRHFRHLTRRHGTASINRLPGALLANATPPIAGGAVTVAVDTAHLTGFKNVGVVWVVPLAILSFALALPPLFVDFRHLNRLGPIRRARHPL